MIMSLRACGKQSPVSRGDCFATCARNDMQGGALWERWLSSPRVPLEGRTLAPGVICLETIRKMKRA